MLRFKFHKSNFQSLGVVYRGSETQLQVTENLNEISQPMSLSVMAIDQRSSSSTFLYEFLHDRQLTNEKRVVYRTLYSPGSG